MNREDAFQFIRLFKQAEREGVKIVDHDKNRVEVEMPGIPGRAHSKFWGDDFDAAVVIEQVTERHPPTE